MLTLHGTSNMYRAVVTDYIYTPIVYDNNNSSYYSDPSSTSSLYNVTVHNQLYLNTNTTLSSAGTVGTAGQVLIKWQRKTNMARCIRGW